jgi:UDP-glucose 4-epimerase
MDLTGQRICITGGGGFVGSHLAERLVADNEVVVVDDFSNGRRDWVPDAAEVVAGDLREPSTVGDAIDDRTDLVVHLAADKAADRDDLAQFRLNNRLTETVLGRMDEVGVRRVAFTSSSTVYGEAPRPTPEDYAPLEPISVYGASKLAAESLLSVYAHSHGVTAWIFRFANVVGPRLQLGAVVPDFIAKLEDDPETLRILGDGRQEKSYLHVDDCVDAICHVVEHAGEGPVHTYNLGTRTTTSVTRIADVVSEEMGLDPDYEFTGGRRGWTGDVPRMRLSIEKLSALGWEPSGSSDDAIRRATRELLEERTGD